MTDTSSFLRTAPATSLLAGVFALVALVAAPQAATAGEEPGALTRALGLRTTVPEAPDFVVKSRHPTQDFIPVHTPRPKPAGKPMPKQEVAKQEKALDSARIRQDRLAGRVSAPPGKSVADSMVSPNDAPKRKPIACRLTCPSPGLMLSRSGREAQ